MMTSQEKKRLLSQYRAMKREQTALAELIHNWDDFGQRIVAVLTGMPKGGSPASRVEISAVNKAELWAIYTARAQKISDALIAVTRAIDTVDDSTLRELLRLRYIEGRTWADIGKVLSYSEAQIWRLHGKALAAVALE